MSSCLSLCVFIPDSQVAQSLTNLLSNEPYKWHQVYSPEEFLNFVREHTAEIDCLVVLLNSSVLPLFNQLYEQGTLLPVIIIERQPPQNREGYQPLSDNLNISADLYHSAEVRLPVNQLQQISLSINQAIGRFLHLGPSCPLVKQSIPTEPPNPVESQPSFLMLQQRRLSEKLKERLGYLGVYYKRSSQDFYRNLSREARQKFLKELKIDYRKIILSYFAEGIEVNQEIDQFVNRAFFADVSASHILEIHMELMDEFAQQLKLEGRSEEILLDYRLTLIDILAHLAEMYRRSVPREDIPFNLLHPLG